MKLSAKWKTYKVLSYAQLVYTVLIFAWFTWQFISIPVRSGNREVPIIIGTILLLMVCNSIINLIFITKNFPDKPVTGGRNMLYIFSVIMNIITFLAAAFATFAGFITELDPEESSKDKSVFIALAILTLISLINLYLLICQFGVRRFLKKNSASSLISMIDSIGIDAASRE